jgi:hypothetical protein
MNFMGAIDKPSIDKLLGIGIVWHDQVPTCLRLPKNDPEGSARLVTKCYKIFMMSDGQWVRFSSVDDDLTGQTNEFPCDKNCDAKCLVAQLAWR